MDKLEKTVRRNLKAADDLSGRGALSSAIEKPLRTGATAARKEAASAIEEQKVIADRKLAETESEIATKRALTRSGRGGRRSLIKSSGGGLSANLGGTA